MANQLVLNTPIWLLQFTALFFSSCLLYVFVPQNKARSLMSLLFSSFCFSPWLIKEYADSKELVLVITAIGPLAISFIVTYAIQHREEVAKDLYERVIKRIFNK